MLPGEVLSMIISEDFNETTQRWTVVDRSPDGHEIIRVMGADGITVDEFTRDALPDILPPDMPDPPDAAVSTAVALETVRTEFLERLTGTLSLARIRDALTAALDAAIASTAE